MYTNANSKTIKIVTSSTDPKEIGRNSHKKNCPAPVKYDYRAEGESGEDSAVQRRRRGGLVRAAHYFALETRRRPDDHSGEDRDEERGA